MKQQQAIISDRDNTIRKLERQLARFSKVNEVLAWSELSNKACSAMLQCTIQQLKFSTNANTFDQMDTTIHELKRIKESLEYTSITDSEDKERAKLIQGLDRASASVEAVYRYKGYIETQNVKAAANPNGTAASDLTYARFVQDVSQARVGFTDGFDMIRASFRTIRDRTGKSEQDAIGDWKASMEKEGTWSKEAEALSNQLGKQ